MSKTERYRHEWKYLIDTAQKELICQRLHPMLELDKQYPQYLFAKHKGYPTKLHVEKLLEHGACPEHRQTFLKKIWERAGR